MVTALASSSAALLSPSSTIVRPAVCPTPALSQSLELSTPALPRPRTVMSLFFLGALGAMGATATADHLTARAIAKLSNPLVNDLEQVLPQAASRLTQTADQLVDDVVEGKTSAINPLSTATPAHEVVVKAGNFYDSWQMLFTVAREQPHLTQAVAAYWAMAGGIGFVGANLLQGLQEAWVRFEESCIRAQLVSRLKDSFTQSIEIKQQQDDANRADTADRLSTILDHQGVSAPRQLLDSLTAPSADQLASHRNFFYMPTNRPLEPTFSGLSSSQPPGEESVRLHSLQPRDGQLSQGHYWLMEHARPLIKTTAVLTGAISGYLAKYTIDHMRQAFSPKPALSSQGASASGALSQPTTRLELNKYINLNNEKASFVELFHERHFKPLLGMLALGALLGVGRQVVTGLREIEVTRLNAETEYNYERFRWLQLDTAYHDIAEKTQLAHLTRRFEQTAPALRNQPEQLQTEANKVLAAVSNLSPPPYYLITPSVQLEAARS